MSLPPDEGDLCGINGCTGTFQILPPPFSFDGYGCSCHIAPPCGWCLSHEVRCTDCGLLPADVEIELDGAEPLTVGMQNRLSKLISRTTIDRDNDVINGDVGLGDDTLVSLDIRAESCEQTNLLRISPELHFPLNEVFEVPDEFNGHQRGTFYYRNGRGNLRGPFMNAEEAGFDLCRRQYSRGFPCR